MNAVKNSNTNAIDTEPLGMGEVPRVDRETEDFIRRIVAETKPHVSYRQSDTPRWRVIVEVVIAAGVIGLVAAHFEDGQFQAKVTSTLHYMREELNAIQSKVQAPFPSDPPLSAVPGEPPSGSQK